MQALFSAICRVIPAQERPVICTFAGEIRAFKVIENKFKPGNYPPKIVPVC
jgi:hypothetical protein